MSLSPLSHRHHPQSSVARAAAIADRLTELGARYDAAPVFPQESMRCLAAAGLHRDFAAPASGGMAFADAAQRCQALMDVLRIIGRADLSVGRLFEGHVNALALFAWYGSPAQAAQLAGELDAGAFYGVWATEPAPGVSIDVKLGGGHALRGAKSFASGAGGLARAIVTARPAAGDRQLVLVDANDAARADLSGWRVRGMRASISGVYDLTGVDVRADDLLGHPGDYDREPRFTTGAWRFAAVQLGGIEALLTETRAAMSEVARTDPLQRAKFAKCVVAARTAYLWVRECAARAANDSIDGPAFARLTRGVVERAGLDVMELAARMIGTRSAMDGQRIDKIIRDLSLYLRQSGPDYSRDQAALTWLDHDAWGEGDLLW
ncbi:acyl-CoA dehydrogenase family protein [Novosphingobium sp. Leaf2]|uniref:acyl-CoA dehydrogenase family protein n=1 Tax=Novosphingobium sp. Leaf2 TaxID=1735670 RepID=UPI000700165C|nr:acyl-CoA dehydrogenase family protein [Novosphingobium sp. Leaf2]KQM12993.1 acyl-CoA dehydrogenase [Novosphingobium sp. Leaf2]